MIGLHLLTRWLPANRLFLRVFGVFGGLLMVMTIGYGMLIVPLQQDSLLKVMYSQASTVSKSIIQACADAIVTNDSGFVVEHNLQVLKNNASIQQVIIIPRDSATLQISPKGWSLHASSPDDASNQMFDAETFGLVASPSGLEYYRYTSPIRFSGVTWGLIRIDFDAGEYRANVTAMYRQLVYSALIALLVTLSIGYFFALWLTKPIVNISAAAARVSRGDLGVRVMVSRGDEIGQLAGSFNQMVDALEVSRDRLRDYNLDLESQVAERTQALDALNHSLDQRVHDEIAKRKAQEGLLIQQSRLAAMGEMIGNIAHQWRQPLNALSLVLQNIQFQHRMGRLTDESMLRMQGKANVLVLQMSSTIDEFRDFFKPSIHAQAFNLKKTVMSSLDIMEGVLKNHSIGVTVDVADDLTLYGVPSEFAQVVLNLLGNAKDALIGTAQREPHIHLRSSRHADRVVMDIEDNGGGIDAGHMAKVFEPYFTTKEEGKGSGIGLYMSKMIVENKLHGRISVVNTGSGARFTLDMPAGKE